MISSLSCNNSGKFLKWILFITLSFSVSFAEAQKHNRNWVFGFYAGINFNVLPPQSFFSNSYNQELSGTFSDSTGNLLFYVEQLNGAPQIQLHDYLGRIINNGDSIISWATCTNGFLSIPSSSDDSVIYCIHIGINATINCGGFFSCYNLYCTILNYYGDSVWVVRRNINLLNERIGEGLAAVKHSNGKDWWILVRGTSWLANDPCTNKFYKFLFDKNGIHGPFTQDIGSITCAKSKFVWGEMTFSKDGSHMAVCLDEYGFIDLFDFDRCTGELSDYRLVDNLIGQFPYSCEFSPSGEVLYISVGLINNLTGRLYQYDLQGANIPSSRTIIWTDTTGYAISGQLQIAPDNRICYSVNFASTLYQSNEHYLSVINAPDSIGLACDFRPFSFYLGDSSKVFYGLPNMPNYELGPLTIYQADAGEDKSWCSNDSMQGAYIGTSEVSGVQYSWHPTEGLDNPNIAMPFANPAQTTMYVLTATDTSIRYSCQSREDTVWVRVENCDTTLPPLIFPDAFTPNDDGINDLFGPVGYGAKLIEFKIFNRWGQQVQHAPSRWDGYYKGKPQPIGTFVYYAVVQNQEGETKHKYGVFSLIR